MKGSERPIQVFIASTSADLQPFREAAKEVVLQQGWHPVMMEYFGAPDGRILDYCRRKVEKADLVVVLVAHRLGEVPPLEHGGDGLHSYTQLEVAVIQEAADRWLLFMADDDWPGRLWEEDAAKRSAVAEWRRSFDHIAKFFRHESVLEGERGEKRLPTFSTLLGAELNRWWRERSGTQASVISTQSASLKQWREPETPAEPYPLLRPYTHPAFFAGREGDLDELVRLLRRDDPIVALFAQSGAGKSSLLQAGLRPRFGPAGVPMAYTDLPESPRLTTVLLNELFEEGSAPSWSGELPSAEDLDAFVGALTTARSLATGNEPVLVLDQFENLWRPTEPGEERARQERARARVGLLLAASLRDYAGTPPPPCRWVLSYRLDKHGEVDSWLRDVLREARSLAPAAASRLHEHLRGRGEPMRLRLFGEPRAARGSPEALAESTGAFLEAIVRPLERWPADRGNKPLVFEEGGAERLAAGLARLRIADDEAALVPELQVVLARLSAAADPDTGDPRVLKVLRRVRCRLRDGLSARPQPVDAFGGVLGRGRFLSPVSSFPPPPSPPRPRTRAPSTGTRR